MATIQNTISLRDMMTKTLANIEKQSKLTERAFRNINNKLDEMDTKSKKASASSSSMFKGIMGANIVSKGIGMITSQLDSAIKRFDTINNYQNVMAGLGFDNEASQKSIDRLKDGLDGLPTTLDDAVSSVQRFAAVNENIGASTEMTLALNDALAAGGTPAATQAAALEQISQAYAKGKFDAIEYKSMMNAMPAQLKQVAQAMGYTSTAVGGDFYNALQKGKIGMNDMMKTMVELDHATGGFHEQAKNATKGIGTAFTNMKTAITKGLADIVENINKSLEDAGLPTIDKIITNIGKTIQRVLISVGSFVGQVIGFLKPVFQFVQNNWDIIQPMLIAAITLFGLWKVATLAQAAAQTILNSALWACPITWIILAIIAIIGLIALVIHKINEVAGTSISATGVIFGAIATAAAYIWNTFVGIVDIALIVINTLRNEFAAFGNFLSNVFVDPVASIIHLFADMADKVCGMIEGIARAIDSVFGSNLAESVEGWRSGLANKANELAEKYGNGQYEKKFDATEITSESLGLKRISYGDAWGAGYNKGSNLFKGSNKASQSTDYLADMDGLVNSVVGADGTGNSGGKAVKTTTDDKLIDDEDIQLLLDIATRDYKLNYQQVTPEITLTFGDIRETADVDNILDAVADRLEEIYDGNLEVART